MNMFKPTTAQTPEAYISMIDEPRRTEIQELHDAIQNWVPNLQPHIMSGMIGYGKYHYKTKTRDGEWMVIALASQKNYISVYVCAMDGDLYLPEKYVDQFPKASIGRSCIRFKKTEDIDLRTLKEVITKGAAMMKKENLII